MIRRPPRSTLDRSSAASDVYKRQGVDGPAPDHGHPQDGLDDQPAAHRLDPRLGRAGAVSYTHLRAHETVLDLVCRLLLENKKQYTASDHNNTQQDQHDDTTESVHI